MGTVSWWHFYNNNRSSRKWNHWQPATNMVQEAVLNVLVCFHDESGRTDVKLGESPIRKSNCLSSHQHQQQFQLFYFPSSLCALIKIRQARLPTYSPISERLGWKSFCSASPACQHLIHVHLQPCIQMSFSCPMHRCEWVFCLKVPGLESFLQRSPQNLQRLRFKTKTFFTTFLNS